MEDVLSTRTRHGQYPGKGFWWIDHVVIDGKPESFLIMFGSDIIGDKACYRVGPTLETFFEPESVNRDFIIVQGKYLIRDKLEGKKVTDRAGKPYNWDTPANAV